MASASRNGCASNDFLRKPPTHRVTYRLEKGYPARFWAHDFSDRQREPVVTHEHALEAKEGAERLLDARPPRSLIGWGAVLGYLARGCNDLGEQERAAGRDGTAWFQEAKRHCDRVLCQLEPEDLEYVAMFLVVETELVRALSALGEVDAAHARIDAALARCAGTDHPLSHGLLHEARALVAWSTGDEATFARSSAEMERWLRPTGTPLLVSRCERLAEMRLASAARSTRPRPAPGRDEPATVVDAPGGRAVSFEITDSKTVRTDWPHRGV